MKFLKLKQPGKVDRHLVAPLKAIAPDEPLGNLSNVSGFIRNMTRGIGEYKMCLKLGITLDPFS